MPTWRNGDLMPGDDADDLARSSPSVRRTIRTKTFVEHTPSAPPVAMQPVSVTPGRHRVPWGRVVGRVLLFLSLFPVLFGLLVALNHFVPWSAQLPWFIGALVVGIGVYVWTVARDERDALD